jgi:hypothetical protein
MVFLTRMIGPVHFCLRYRDEFKAALDLTAQEEELDELFLSQLIQLVQELSVQPGRNGEVKKRTQQNQLWKLGVEEIDRRSEGPRADLFGS